MLIATLGPSILLRIPENVVFRVIVTQRQKLCREDEPWITENRELIISQTDV
jgi:hypothetical protein